MPIQILPDDVASQIAAGEVVERPASVVKELLENSIDSEAKRISITISDAGKRLIEVKDDGFGISPAELPLAVAHHATSKLNTAEDLFHIETLGFRGEALASIGSVSHLSILSRRLEDELGMRIKVEGGDCFRPEPVGAPAGTMVRVEDLFFNVPARKKFLRTDRTERKHIDNVVTRYALAYPEIKFQLLQENRRSLQTSGNGDRREVLAVVHGADIAKQMIEVISEDEQYQITGFISPISLSRTTRREIIFFVNGRPIFDPALATSLIQAYHTMLMVGRYPMAVIFISMPPDLVDVNVHPTKAEVRFSDRNAIFRTVGRSVRKALLAHTPIPSIDGLSKPIRWSSYWGKDPHSERNEIDPAWGMVSQNKNGESDDPLIRGHHQRSFPIVTLPLLRLIGQVATTYLIAEGPDGLYLIDQHAAHERVLFERFLSDKKSEIPSQTLLDPVTVEIPPAQVSMIEEHLEVLNSLGFRVELFGTGMYIVRGIPTLLSNMEPADALRVIIDDFEEDESPLAEEIEERIIARICKRAAIKSGMVLTREEQQKLLSDLESCQTPRTCPHGRPTMIHLSVGLLERQFGRKG